MAAGIWISVTCRKRGVCEGTVAVASTWAKRPKMPGLPPAPSYTLVTRSMISSCDGSWRRLSMKAKLSGYERTAVMDRSEEHTSELQSQSNLVCRLLLEKKKKKTYTQP